MSSRVENNRGEVGGGGEGGGGKGGGGEGGRGEGERGKKKLTKNIFTHAHVYTTCPHNYSHYYMVVQTTMYSTCPTCTCINNVQSVHYMYKLQC